MLTESQFDILYYLYKLSATGTDSTAQPSITQRYLAQVFDFSLGKLNGIISQLEEEKLIKIDQQNYSITENGIKSLEPYKVSNAIIMAAGMSSRFAPLSYERPKGLLRVKGDILIEREIKQLQEAGITDITIVVGYMKEAFFYLAEKFNVKIVVNEDYYRYNNTSTLIRVTDKLSNTYICSSDNYFVENVFEPYVYKSYYSTVFTPGDTDEWCVKTDPKGRIKQVTVGGQNSWYMLGHVYWDKSFSQKFVEILKKEYDKAETKDGLWEKLYVRNIKDLDLYIKKYDSDKVKEFDSLEELREFDSEYINNADSSILRNICKILDCSIKDITNIKAIKAGLTNTSFQFSVNGQNYVYRHPGRGTENYINRESEAFSMEVAKKLELDNTFVYMDCKQGWKISKFVQNARELNYDSPKEVDKAIVMMQKLHNANIKSKFDFNIWNKTEDFIETLKKLGKINFEGFEELHNTMLKVHQKVTTDKYSRNILCHCDCYSPNFLFNDKDELFLIDWEYSGNDDPASDLGTFICCSTYDFNKAVEIIEKYLNHKPDAEELSHYLGYVSEASYYWYVWALYQETRGNPVGEWEYLWFKNSQVFAKACLDVQK